MRASTDKRSARKASEYGAMTKDRLRSGVTPGRKVAATPPANAVAVRPAHLPVRTSVRLPAACVVAVGTALAFRFGPPPAQIPASGTTALGSCLGF